MRNSTVFLGFVNSSPCLNFRHLFFHRSGRITLFAALFILSFRPSTFIATPFSPTLGFCMTGFVAILALYIVTFALVVLQSLGVSRIGFIALFILDGLMVKFICGQFYYNGWGYSCSAHFCRCSYGSQHAIVG